MFSHRGTKASHLTKPRILIVNSALYIGGAENVTAALCRGLDRERFDVCVAHLKGHGPIARELEGEGYKVIGIPAKAARRDLLTSLKLRRVIVEQGIDLVHSQDLHTMVDASLCALSLPGLRHVSTFHHGHYPRDSWRYHALERVFLRGPDRLVAVGEVQRQSIAKTYGVATSRMTVIRNGVADALARAKPDQKDRIRRGAEVVIGSISTLIEQKGIEDLLQAAYRLVEQRVRFRLVVVGDGHLRATLESRSKQLGLGEQVEFLGWIEDAASRVLPWIDVFVQSSLWEAMSMVVLEAMSCRCPVVATSVGDNPFVIRHGESGFLVAPGNTEELARYLRRLVEDSALRQRFAEECRRDYEERFTAARMCRDYEALYWETCAGK